jgi:lipocalin
MTIKALILSVALIVAVSAVNYQPVNSFDASKLVGTQWYEAFFANNQTAKHNACTRYVFTSGSNSQLTYQKGYYQPGLTGDLLSSTLNLQQSGSTGTFQVTTSGQQGDLMILDYDDESDCSWIVIADTNQNLLSVLSKSSQNSAGLARAIELAEEYGQDSHHLESQVSQCPYTNIFSALKKARN